jgi:hypothetical protein
MPRLIKDYKSCQHVESAVQRTATTTALTMPLGHTVMMSFTLLHTHWYDNLCCKAGPFDPFNNANSSFPLGEVSGITNF